MDRNVDSKEVEKQPELWPKLEEIQKILS